MKDANVTDIDDGGRQTKSERERELENDMSKWIRVNEKF